MSFQLTSAFTLTFLGCIFTLFGITNYFIYDNFEISFELILQDAYDIFFWRKTLPPSLPIYSSYTFTIVVLRILAECIRNLRDLYVELFFVSAILTLWPIGADFNAHVKKQIAKLKMRKVTIRQLLVYQFGYGCHSPRVIKSAMKQYREICKLCEQFTNAFGLAMFSYFLMSVTYYSVTMDKLYLPLKWGAKFYLLEYVFTAGIIYGLGSHFSMMVIYLLGECDYLKKTIIKLEHMFFCR